MSGLVKAILMNFNMVDIFVQVFNDLFSYIDIDHKFMCEVPESSLNSTERVNTLIGITGELEGNIMFCYSTKTAKDIAAKLFGTEAVPEIDIYVKSALADFYSDFCKRFTNLIKIANMYDDSEESKNYTLLSSNPTYVAGDKMYGMISKIPSKKLFFKINGEKFGIAYSLAKK